MDIACNYYDDGLCKLTCEECKVLKGEDCDNLERSYTQEEIEDIKQHQSKEG